MMRDLKIILLTLICFTKESYTFHRTGETQEQFLAEENQNHNLLGQNEHLHDGLNYPESSYSNDYNDIDHNNENIDRVALKEVTASNTPTSKSTPALSALTLLGFLYFLGYIQDVLQGTNVRKKREADGTGGTTEVESYLQSIENVISSIEKFVPTESGKEADLPNRSFIKDSRAVFGPDKSGKSKDGKKSSGEEVVGRSVKVEARETGTTLEERADKIVSFFGSIFEKIPRFFGFNKKATARNDYDISNIQSDTADPGFWSLFGSKVGQIATLMDFLGDPSPTRIGKRNTEVERDDVVDDQLIAQPSELNAEDRNFLAPYEDSEDPYLIRRKRFTDGMNVWYSEAAHGRQSSSDGIGADGRILKLVFNLFKGALTT